MIKIENEQIVGWEPALRGMRNPKNSWEKSDSEFICPDEGTTRCCGEPHIGPNDHKLIMSLVRGGVVHAKFRRMIVVYVDVTAPLYWWKEYDTYKVGTVANSCSTMHKIMDHEFTEKDFSWDGIEEMTEAYRSATIKLLNDWRDLYFEAVAKKDTQRQKYCWKRVIKLLGTAYNQKRTLMLNYEVLHGIYFSRKNHKLDEWVEFCKWTQTLPYSEIITTPEARMDISFEDETHPRRSIMDALRAFQGREVTVIIGPEGDFSKEEADKALAAGYIPVHLGPSRLRTETAAVTAAEAVYLNFI